MTGEILKTRRELQVWAASQPQNVQRAAEQVIIGLAQSRPSDSPIMRRLLAADVERLKTSVAQVKGKQG